MNGHEQNHSDESSSTRDKILAAGLALFANKGYVGATTKEIAHEAGIAEVTLFRHFSSKEKLLEEVLNRRSFVPAMKELMPIVLELGYIEGLTLIANRYLDSVIMLKDWVRLFHTEMQRSPDKMQQMFHRFLDELFGTFAAYFKIMQERGVLKDFDPELGARAFHGIFFSFFHFEEVMLRKNYRPTDREKAIREFINIFATGTLKLDAEKITEVPKPQRSTKRQKLNAKWS